MSGWCAGPPGACSAEWPRFPEATGRPSRRAVADALGTVRHVFTHFALDFASSGATSGPGGWWQPIDRLAEAGTAEPLSPRRRSSPVPSGARA